MVLDGSRADFAADFEARAAAARGLPRARGADQIEPRSSARSRSTVARLTESRFANRSELCPSGCRESSSSKRNCRDRISRFRTARDGNTIAQRHHGQDRSPGAFWGIRPPAQPPSARAFWDPTPSAAPLR